MVLGPRLGLPRSPPRWSRAGIQMSIPLLLFFFFSPAFDSLPDLTRVISKRHCSNYGTFWLPFLKLLTGTIKHERCQPSPSPPVSTSRQLLEGADNRLPVCRVVGQGSPSPFPGTLLSSLAVGRVDPVEGKGGLHPCVQGWVVKADVAGKRDRRRTRRSHPPGPANG